MANKFGGRPMGGGMGGMNMNALMRQAQKMQQDIADKKEELKAREYSAESGGGAVKATVNGNNEIVALELSPDVVDPADTEMLGDLITVAVNQALRAAAADAEAEMNRLTGGMGGML